MTVSLSLLAGAGWQFFDDNGNPLSGGLLYTYEAGTTTPQATYTDSTGNVANANPIVLDAAGRVPYQVWLTAQAIYKFILKTSLGVTVWTEDNVEADLDAAALAASNGSSLIGFLQAGTGAVARTVQSKLRDVISAKDFGAVGDGVTDDTAALQAAINAVIYNNNLNPANGLKLKVHIPGGKYRITDTIHVGYGTAGSQFTSCVIEGDGYAYRGASNFSGTTIIADFNDRPAINFQGARGSVLRGVAIVGRNTTWVTTNQLGSVFGSLIDDTIAANWVDPAFPASASSRYAPYAAVTIDAYSGPQPATSYPSVTYPAFLGVVAQYNKAFSSDVLIEDVYIDGFVVGMVNQPGDADGNGDFTTLRRVSIERCQYGVSVCNTQSRNFGLHALKINSCYTGLTTNKHGRRDGRLNGTINDFHIGSSIQMIELNNSSIYGPVTFLHAYAEAIWQIGSITASNAVETSLIFQSCIIEFQNQNDTRGVPAKILNGAQTVLMDCQFIGCSLGNFKSVMTLWQNGVRLHGTALNPSGRDTNLNPATQLYIAGAHNALAGGLVTPNFQSTPYQSIKYIAFNLDTAAIQSSIFSQDQMRSSTRVTCTPIYAWSVAASEEPYSDNVRTPRYVAAVGKTALTISLTNKTLTVTFPGRADWAFNLYGPDNSDVIIDDETGMTFFVRSRTGTAIIAEAQNNYKSNGSGGFNTIQPFSTTSGNLYWVTGRIYTPKFYLRGDTSSASPVITNCARDDGFAAWYNAQIAVNDRVYVFETQDNWISVVNSLITARDQAAGTITLANNPARTEIRRRLAVFARQPPANV